jgi:hypothetical protein
LSTGDKAAPKHLSSSLLEVIFCVSSGDDRLFTPAEEADITKKIEQKIADFKTAAG